MTWISTVSFHFAIYSVKMPLGYATQSVCCNQPTAASEKDTCEDRALFSSDIAMLYGASGESASPIHTEYTENSGTFQIQNDQDEGGTNTQVPMCPMPNTTSRPQNHSFQIPACAMAQILNASQCRGVIFWFPSSPDAELLKAILEGRSAGCPEHVNIHATCCLPQKTDTCLQLPGEIQSADQMFAVPKSYNDQNQRPSPLDDTLNPSTLSISAGTSSIHHGHFKCSYPGCKQYFKRQRTLDRHLNNHIGERLHVCWVPGCQRSFSRSDNLNAHYTTHGTHRGRNRYVATLDKTGPVYDPNFRGQLTLQGWPLGGAA